MGAVGGKANSLVGDIQGAAVVHVEGTHFVGSVETVEEPESSHFGSDLLGEVLVVVSDAMMAAAVDVVLAKTR